MEEGGEEDCIGLGESLAVGVEEHLPAGGEAARLEDYDQSSLGVA